MEVKGGIPKWSEYYMYSVQFNALAAGNSGLQYTDGEIRIDSDADFEFMKTMYQSSDDLANVYLKYKDDTTGRYLMKNAASARTIGGRSLPVDNSGAYDFRPFIWPVPYIIKRATTFMVQAANDHAVITPTVYLTFHGAKKRIGVAPWKKPAAKMPYVYGLTRSASTLPESVVQIPANGTLTTTISIDKDSSFVATKITGSAQGNALITIQEMGRDRQWMNTSTHIRNVIGSGAEPNILPAPRYLEKGSVVSISLQDLSGAANNIELNIIGFKMFTKQR